MTSKTVRSKPERPITLSVDIGGSGLKVMLVSAGGAAIGERVRVATPRPATPRAILRQIAKMIPEEHAFDRVSVGFPGVVIKGVVRTAPNLHSDWRGTDLETAVRDLADKPTRVLNDAGVQGFGAIQGEGLEVCITLGTGMGFSLFLDGRYVPNVEMAHHPCRSGRSYEDLLGARALKRDGRKKWNRNVARAVALLESTFNYRALYVGGGNAKKLTIELPKNVTMVSNLKGLLGGVRLWEDQASERALLARERLHGRSMGPRVPRRSP